MKNITEKNIKYFNELSSSIFNTPYTNFYHMAFMGNTDQEFVNYIIKEAFIDKDSTVLDLGCGSGYLVNQLNNMCDAKGITNSKGNLEVCKNLYPNNKYELANMETYKSKPVSHILTLESFNYSNIEKTFKACYKNLKAGGLLFMKEWCVVEEDSDEIQENCKALQDTFFYTPHAVSSLVEAAKKAKLKLVDEQNLINNINTHPYSSTLEYHSPEVRDFVFPHNVETLLPIQLKFKK